MKGLVKVARPTQHPLRATKTTSRQTSAAKKGSRTAEKKIAKGTKPGKALVSRTKAAAEKATRPRPPASKSVIVRTVQDKPNARKPTGTATAARKKIGAKTSAAAAQERRSSDDSPRLKSGDVKTSRPRTKSVPPPVPQVQPAPVIDLAKEKEAVRALSVTAVNRAMELLEALSRSGPVPLAVLADLAGCGKANALALLSALQTRNFAIQDEAHGLWRLGARWAVLGRAASEQGALAATAMPHLASLGNATGENVYLRVREGMECETVAIYQTDPGLRIYSEVGKRMPLHAGSGRVLLAHSPEAVQTQVLAQRLQRYTPSTRTDPTWIAADLHRIRQRGFLITDSEVVAGTVTVGAPVRDASGQVVALLLISAPSLRMRPPRPRALMPAVVDSARKLSQALGFIVEQPVAAPAEGQAEARRQGEFTPPPVWPGTASDASTPRTHSIFR
jgi:IclR family KDG regulon transcriptional repressor